MNTLTRVFAIGIGASLVACPVSAQTRVEARTAVHAESYKFDEASGLARASQLSVPLGINLTFGRFGDLALSGGYAYTLLETDDADDQQIQGLTDTQLRLSINLMPGRLTALIEGALPTGVSNVPTQDIDAFGLISSDLISFTTNSFGVGGGVGGGLVAAVPVGRMALGFGATYLQPFTYEPFQPLSPTESPATLRVGGELRMRAGVEGPVSRRSYIRFAGVFAVRQKDQVNGSEVNGVGNRLTGYLAFNQGFGNSSATLYVFDVYRGTPSISGSAVGATVLPKGNLLSLGGQASLGAGRVTAIIPTLEYRLSHAAPFSTGGGPSTQGTGSLRKIGSSVRAGLSFAFTLSQATALVLNGSYLTGDFTPENLNTVDYNGFRVAINFQLTP